MTPESFSENSPQPDPSLERPEANEAYLEAYEAYKQANRDKNRDKMRMATAQMERAAKTIPELEKVRDLLEYSEGTTMMDIIKRRIEELRGNER